MQITYLIYLKKGEEEVELPLVRSLLKESAARLEQTADQANAKVVIRQIDGTDLSWLRITARCISSESVSLRIGEATLP